MEDLTKTAGLTDEQSKAAKERNENVAADKAAKEQAAADKAAADKAAKEQAAADKAAKKQAAADKGTPAKANPELRAELEENFKHHPSAIAFWVASDKTPFFTENDAKNYQLTLADKEYLPVKVER